MITNLKGVFIKATDRLPTQEDGILLMRLCDYEAERITYGVGMYKYSIADMNDRADDLHMFFINNFDATVYARELEYLIIKNVEGATDELV